MNAKTDHSSAAVRRTVSASPSTGDANVDRQRTLYRAFTAGLANGATPAQVRSLLARHHSSRIAAPTPAETARVAASVRAFLRAEPGVVRVRAARAAVAHLSDPARVARRDLLARVIVAQVAQRVCADPRGWDTVLLSAADLAVDLGCSVGGARNALRAAIDNGWVVVVSRRPGGATRVRLRQRLTAVERARSEERRHITAAWAEQRPEHGVGVLMSATEPAWAYPLEGGPDWTVWRSLAADVLGSPMTETAGRHRAGLRRATALGLSSADLSALDRWWDPAAVSAVLAARDRRRQDRASAVIEHRVSTWVDRVVVAAGDPVAASDRRAWCEVAAACLDRVRVGADRPLIAARLAALLAAAGWPHAVELSERLVGIPAGDGLSPTG